MPEVIKNMTLLADRFVTPSFHMNSAYRNLGIMIPELIAADNDAVWLEFAPRFHQWNYPATPGGYAANNVTAEFRCDGTVLTGNPAAMIDEVNNLYLTPQGNPATESAGVKGYGQAIAFDGTGDAYDILVTSIPTGVLPTTGDFSIEVVFKATTGHNTDVLMCCKDGAFDGAGVGWSLQLDANEHLDFVIDDGTTAPITLTGTADVADGTYKHVIVSLDKRGNGVIYLNGAADDTTAISSAPLTLLPVDSVGTSRLCFGGDAARGATENFFGSISFARIYNKALTAADALANYRILMGHGWPGWVPIIDPVTGDPLPLCDSGKDPCYFDLTPFVTTLPPVALRACIATEQATTPTILPFVFIES